MTASEAPPIALTDDEFLGGRLRLLQPVNGLRAGLDAVMLAAAVSELPKDQAQILEAGSGSGIVSLLIASRFAGAEVMGIEIEPELVRLARTNAARNGLDGRVRFIRGDVTAPFQMLHDAGVVRETFDHVVANPPFFEDAAGRSSPDAFRRRAASAEPGSLTAWMKFVATVARHDAGLTLIHHAGALGELLSALEGRFGDAHIYPLYPRSGAAAIRVLVAGVKGSRAPAKILEGLVLHEANGMATPRAEAILRRGDNLVIRPARG